MSVSKFELSLLYFNALSACCDANCTMDEDDTDMDSYIRHRLYTAMYDMTEFLIRRLDGRPPAALEHRLYRIPELYGNGYRVPCECFKLVHRDVRLYRDDLAIIGQVIDQWFSIKCAKFVEECLPGSYIHSYVS